MIEVYTKSGNSNRYPSLAELPEDHSDFLGIQLLDAVETEIEWIQQQFGLDLSILQNRDDIEISSHFREQENQVSFQFSLPYVDKQGDMVEEPLLVILSGGRMFSFMSIALDQHLSEIDNLRMAVKTMRSEDVKELLILVLGLIADYYADLTELIAKRIKNMAVRLLKKKEFIDDDLDSITELNFNNILIKESLNEFQRILRMFKRSTHYSDASIREKINSELSDLIVISDYIQYNFDRLDDLKDNITSKIDLEQNRIFKTLTIVTVCIAMPTLIAGIYGMNFKIMPELSWSYGYPAALLVMLFSIVIPIIYFRKKKWM